ncbi:hypothetical protein SFC65_19120 [Priestia filamentosa]|uniref:hypothetical protein n=1 Tax=Priestia filamentosa TaxID=1402861 RepID=UPI003982C47F
MNSNIREEISEHFAKQAAEYAELNTKVGQTTLEQCIDFLDRNRASIFVTFNIYKDGILSLNTTMPFFRIEEDEFNPQVYIFGDGKTSRFMDKRAAKQYVLEGANLNKYHLTFKLEL